MRRGIGRAEGEGEGRVTNIALGCVRARNGTD